MIQARPFEAHCFSPLLQQQLQSALFQDPVRSRAMSGLGCLFGGDSVGFQSLAALQFQRTTIGYAAMPDFANAGHLDVNKEKGVVTTPGGFNISVAEGRVRIQNPDGKWTDLKAEPPERTVTSTSTNTETRTLNTQERILPRDPAVRESDGDVWRYQGTGTFALPDGTRIKIQEGGEGKDLHINQVDITNGNKHLTIESKLTSSEYETYKKDVASSATAWQTTSTSRTVQSLGRGGAVINNATNQQRQVTTTVTEQQRANQKFQTTFGDVKNDGFLTNFQSDIKGENGEMFRLAGNGQAWSKDGKEVLSGAGKGKDDKTKAFQLGNAIDDSRVGERPLMVPWNVYAFGQQDIVSMLFAQQYQASASHWGGLEQGFGQCRGGGHLGAQAQIFGGLNSIYGGPCGGAGLYGLGQADAAQFGSMQSSVAQLLALYQSMGSLQNDCAHRRLAMPMYR